MSEVKQQAGGAGAQQQTPQQQTPQQQTSQLQENQGMQVQIPHNGSDQINPQGTQVVSSNASMIPTSTMVMAAPQAMIQQQAMQNLQNPPTMSSVPSQSGSTTITSMSAGPPQQMTDWSGSGRVQVIQQPIQNPTYIQPVYNAQGQLIVPGNIALHPGNMNQPIQVIAAGKAFQPGQMPHMLATSQGKPIVQGQTTSFPGYATIPTSGNNQTLVISQLGVLGQTNMLPQPQGKPQEMQKMLTKTNVAPNNMKTAPTQQQNVSIGNLVNSQPQGITTQAQTIIQPQILSPIQYTCNTQQQRTVPQGPTQAMQFAPWQATFGPTGLPQGLTWAPGAIQSSALLTQGSQIFIRNPQQDQTTGMFIQNAQPSIPHHNQMAVQPISKPNQIVEMGGNVLPKTSLSKTFSTILPNSIGPQTIRPASSVTTQTVQTQAPMHQATFQSLKTGTKVRTKNVCRMPTMATSQKTDVSNQTKSSTAVQVLQPKLLMSNVQPGPTSNVILSQDKTIKQAQGQPQALPLQGQQQQQQPLTQIQQIQNMFQEQIDPKAQPNPVVISNGITNPNDRGGTVMPVVSMPTGQMTPIMGNMIVQTVPGIPHIAGQTVQTYPVTQGIFPTSIGAQAKEEIVKENNVHENGTSDISPGENTSGSEDSVADKTQNVESDVSSETKEKLPEEKDSKENDKKDGGGQPKATLMVKPQVLTHVIEGFVIQESSEPFPVSRSSVISRKNVGDILENGEPPKKKSMVDSSQDVEADVEKVNPLKWTVAEVCDFIRNLPGCADYVEDFAMQDIDGEALMLLKPDHLMSAMSMKLGPAVKIISKIDTMRLNAASKDGA